MIVKGRAVMDDTGSADRVSILIAEDSATQARWLKHILEGGGYDVTVCQNGAEALTMADRISPRLVISDILMPVMDGFELCRRIKADKKLRDIPVILLSTLADPKDIIRGLECEADNYIPKPYDRQYLLARIAQVLQDGVSGGEASEDDDSRVMYYGQTYRITSHKRQILSFLVTTYETVMQKNLEIARANEALHAENRERILVEEQLKTRNAELIALNEQKNQFLGIAAHDLRSPIATINTLTDTLLRSMKDKMTGDDKEYLDYIRDLTTYMMGMLNNLLDVSAIESGYLILRPVEVDMQDVVRESVRLFESSAQQANITIEMRSERGMTVWADAVRLREVADNLISNAIKYSQPGSQVVVSTQCSGDECVLSVRDQGVGIPHEDMERIFRPFGVSTRLSGPQKSTGLGLTIVRRVAEAHGGRVWVESTPDVGSTFHVAIPRWRVDDGEEA